METKTFFDGARGLLDVAVEVLGNALDTVDNIIDDVEAYVDGLVDSQAAEQPQPEAERELTREEKIQAIINKWKDTGYLYNKVWESGHQNHHLLDDDSVNWCYNYFVVQGRKDH